MSVTRVRHNEADEARGVRPEAGATTEQAWSGERWGLVLVVLKITVVVFIIVEEDHHLFTEEGRR